MTITELQEQYNRVSSLQGYKEAYKTVYLTSQHWKSLRLKVLNRDKHTCQTCNTKQHLQVHHLTYERLFQEDVSDLVTLCKGCHEATHASGDITQPVSKIRHVVQPTWTITDLQKLTKRPKGCPKKLWKRAKGITPQKAKKTKKPVTKHKPKGWKHRIQAIQRDIDRKRQQVPTAPKVRRRPKPV